LPKATEFSAKFYRDNFATNPITQYHAGTMLDVDFAVTEHIGRFQIGPAGFYAFQVADDQQNGMIVPPDGRKLNYMVLGGELGYDMPNFGAVLKIKVVTAVIADNAPAARSINITLAKKLF
jgi:hypothetical protein